MAAGDDESGAAAPGRAYTLLLRSVWLAWVCCAVALAAMLPALVLRSPACVAVFELGLRCCFLALAAAAVFAVISLTRPQVNGITLPRRHGARVATLVAVVLADLLDGG